MEKEVVILCGGQGTRLQPVVSDRPKVLAEMASQRPFLDTLIAQVKLHGFNKIILAVGHLREHVKKQYATDPAIQFSEETEPLGTGGALKKALALVTGSYCLVMNGDSFCDVDLEKFYQFHKEQNSPFSIVLAQSKNRKDAGNVQVDDQGKLTTFEEKKGNNGLINAGIYGVRKDIEKYFPQKTVFSLEHEVFPVVISESCYGFIVNTEVMDIGTPERYYKYSKNF